MSNLILYLAYVCIVLSVVIGLFWALMQRDKPKVEPLAEVSAENETHLPGSDEYAISSPEVSGTFSATGRKPRQTWRQRRKELEYAARSKRRRLESFQEI